MNRKLTLKPDEQGCFIIQGFGGSRKSGNWFAIYVNVALVGWDQEARSVYLSHQQKQVCGCVRIVKGNPVWKECSWIYWNSA